MSRLGAALTAFLLITGAALGAEERATTKDAELMVHKAVEFLKKSGREAAVPVFNDPKGAFTYRDLYIAVLDAKGTTVAHGAKKELLGKGMWNAKDVDGKYFARDMVQQAAANGKGWYEYKFQNPATGNVEQKVAYFERVGDLTVLCGAYRP